MLRRELREGSFEEEQFSWNLKNEEELRATLGGGQREEHARERKQQVQMHQGRKERGCRCIVGMERKLWNTEETV